MSHPKYGDGPALINLMGWTPEERQRLRDSLTAMTPEPGEVATRDRLLRLLDQVDGNAPAAPGAGHDTAPEATP